MALNLYQSNYIKELEEEIALEGLDGITIDALWERLLDRPVCSFRPLTDQTKAFLWAAVIQMENINFYLLPSPRPPIFIFRRLDNVDSAGNYLEPHFPPTCYSYPHLPVEANGEMGSCPLYYQRKNITSKVRGVPLEKALKTWGSRLVIVANQKTRVLYLIEPESNLLCEMNIKQFCFLERVGRSRQHGEVTQGKTGLQSITEDSKTLFYYKKFLSKHKLIKQQVFFLRSGKTNCTGLIIHLPRYSLEVKTRFVTDSEKVADFLRSQPEEPVLYKLVSEKFGDYLDLKKLIMKEPKKFRSELIPYKQMYPNSDPKEWKIKNGGDKFVRVLRLIETENDDEEEDEENEVGNGYLPIQYRKLGASIVRQCYEIIETAGHQGISQGNISQILGLTNLHARSLCRYLTKKGICGTASVDKGRQRVIHYFSKKYESSNGSLATELEKEKDKLLTMLGRNTEAVEPPCKRTRMGLERSFFMPTVQPSQEDIDAIETEISISEFVPQTDNFNSLIGDTGEADSAPVTARCVRRAQLILKAVNFLKVIHDPQKLQKMITEEEEAEGHKYAIDRKTITRLVDKLVKDGHVRIMKVKLKGQGREKILHFIVHPSVDAKNSEIISAIDQAKMKLPIITKDLIKKESKASRQENSKSRDSPLKLFNLGKYDNKAGRKYGLKPKFVKKQVLHSYIFYLVYGHNGKEATPKEIKTLLKNKNVDESLMDEMSAVYSTKGDWKTFLSPLPQHKGYTDGWCLVSDLLLRLPLVLFMSMVNVPYEIPGLMDYLNHPIKKYYLVKNLPQEIANTLTIHRKYIFTISELITKLAFMGLVQVGPQKLKEKDQYFIYVNRNAILLDTTPSASGYNHISQDMTYEPMSYEFKSLEDVEQYWYDLWNFAMNTNLGCRNVMSGKPVVIESVLTKKVLMETIKPRGIEEASELDVGYLPGDHLGAAGLDSDLFVHLKRNWYWTADNRLDAHGHGKSNIESRRSANKQKSPTKKREHPKSSDSPAVEIKKIKLVAPSNRSKDEAAGTSKPDKVEESRSEQAPNPQAVSDKEASPPLKPVPLSKAKHRKITRFLKPKGSKIPRKPYYDQVDKEALRRMVKLRVDWSRTEDNLLLICKVASLYMSADTRRHVAKNFCVVREILHSNCPTLSQNKTSRACQRRMTYMMKNPSTAHSVYLCLEEIKQDPEISDKFGMAVEKMDRLVKSQGKGPKVCQAEYDKIYADLVGCLLAKLKTITTPEEATLENVSIPDTLDAFRKSYQVVVPKNLSLRYGSYIEVQNIVDIMCSTVNTVIHSSLCCSNDKTSYSYQLFFVYQQYPDKLLRSVMARCRSMQIVSCRKRYKRWKTANSGCLPLSSSPYQLSITYINILQTRYQYSIYHESNTALAELFSQLQAKKEAIASMPSSSSATNKPITVEIQVGCGGECANIVELFSIGYIEIDVVFPQHLIILDPRISEQEESYTLIMKRFREMLTIINSNKKAIEDDDREEDNEEDEELANNNTNPSDADKTLSDDFNLTNKSGVANTASRLALYMMRDEPVEYLDKSLQHAHDYFVLKPCKLKVKVNEDIIKKNLVNKETAKYIVKEIQRMAVFPEKPVESDVVVGRLGDICNKGVLTSLINFIETKKELGALYSDIINHVEGPLTDIHGCLDALISNHFVLRSGNVHLRFIHNKFKKPWVVRSYYIPRQKRDGMPTTNTNVSYALQLKEDSDDEQPSAVGALPRRPLSIPMNKDEDNVEVDTPEAESSSSKDKPVADEEQSQDASSVKATGKPNEPVVMVLRTKKRRWASLKENKFGEFDFSAMEPVQVNIRPWIRVDGTLNRKVLDRLLGTVLGHCLSMPGVPLKTLQDRLTPAIQPVHTYDLVLILQKIGAFKLNVLKRTKKPSLFSKRRVIVEEPASGYEDADQVMIHPQLLAVTQLGQFLSERHLGKDYLDALTDSRLLSFS